MNDKAAPQASQEPPISLNDIRTEISQLDHDLLSLLARRRELSRAVAISKQLGLRPIRDQPREQQLLDVLVQKGSESGLDSHYVTKLFHTIIEDSLSVQREYLQSQSNPDYHHESLKSIAVLGGRGAYSYLAAGKYFSDSHNHYLACSTFDKVLKSVELGKVDFGVVPIEKSADRTRRCVADVRLDGVRKIYSTGSGSRGPRPVGVHWHDAIRVLLCRCLCRLLDVGRLCAEPATLAAAH